MNDIYDSYGSVMLEALNPAGLINASAKIITITRVPYTSFTVEKIYRVEIEILAETYELANEGSNRTKRKHLWLGQRDNAPTLG